MRLAVTTVGAVLGLALAVLSMPWVVYAIGRGMLGDDEGADHAIDAAPLSRWLDWIEARRVRV